MILKNDQEPQSQPQEALVRQKMPPMERHAQKKSLRRILFKPSADGSRLHDIEYFRFVDGRFHPLLGWCDPFQARVLLGMLEEKETTLIYRGVAVAIRNDGLGYYYVSSYHELQRPYSNKIAHSVAVGRAAKLALGYAVEQHGDHIVKPEKALLHRSQFVQDGKVLEGRALRTAALTALKEQGVVKPLRPITNLLLSFVS